MANSNFSQRLIRRGLRAGINALSRSIDQEQVGRLAADLLLGGGTSTSSDSRGGTHRGPGSSPGRADKQKTSPQKRGGSQKKRDDFSIARRAEKQPIKQGFPKRPSGGYPGDFTGTVRPVYSPDLDGNPDPGEVVWAWVPYEEDSTKGKDRPVLLVGHDGSWLLGLMLTSQDHVPGNVGEIRQNDGTPWINIGSGDWDSKNRPSEIRLDRVIRIAPNAVRREGSIMPMTLYSKIVENIDTGGQG